MGKSKKEANRSGTALEPFKPPRAKKAPTASAKSPEMEPSTSSGKLNVIQRKPKETKMVFQTNHLPFRYEVERKNWDKETFGKLFDALILKREVILEEKNAIKSKNSSSLDTKFKGEELFTAIGKFLCDTNEMYPAEKLNLLYTELSELETSKRDLKDGQDVESIRVIQKEFARKVAGIMTRKPARLATALQSLIRLLKDGKTDQMKLQAIFNGMVAFLVLRFYQIRFAHSDGGDNEERDAALKTNLPNVLKFFEKFKKIPNLCEIDWEAFEANDLLPSDDFIISEPKKEPQALVKLKVPKQRQFQVLVEQALNHYEGEDFPTIEKVLKYLENCGTEIEKKSYLMGVKRLWNLVKSIGNPKFAGLKKQLGWED